MSDRSPHRDDAQVDLPVMGGNVRISGRKDLVAAFLAFMEPATAPPVERPPYDSTGQTQAPPRLVSDGGEHRDRESSEQNLEGLPDL